MMKLSPARRVLLLIAIVLFLVSRDSAFIVDNNEVMDTRTEWISALLFLLVLALELADKVIMKRDLEIAREIQNWLVPSSRSRCTWWRHRVSRRDRKIRWPATTTTRFIRRRAARRGRQVDARGRRRRGEKRPGGVVDGHDAGEFAHVAGDDAPLDAAGGAA